MFSQHPPQELLYLLAARKRSSLWYRQQQIIKLLQHLTWLLFTSVQCPLPTSSGWWNESTPMSLSEALLDGYNGEETRELLDDSCVYLWAEGDIQKEELWTTLEEFLQWGRAHQSSTCQSENRREHCKFDAAKTISIHLQPLIRGQIAGAAA